MTNILINDANPETKNLLMKCLETGGFDVITTEDGLVRVQLAQKQSYTNNQLSKANQFVFPSIPRLREVFEFIELNYHHNIKLKEVAQAVDYSSAYLTDLVRKLTGKTVNNWIIERRIAQACRLLLETNYSVYQISLEVGYQNLNHFYCQFRDRLNTTPKAWREASLNCSRKKVNISAE